MAAPIAVRRRLEILADRRQQGRRGAGRVRAAGRGRELRLRAARARGRARSGRAGFRAMRAGRRATGERPSSRASPTAAMTGSCDADGMELPLDGARGRKRRGPPARPSRAPRGGGDVARRQPAAPPAPPRRPRGSGRRSRSTALQSNRPASSAARGLGNLLARRCSREQPPREAGDRRVAARHARRQSAPARGSRRRAGWSRRRPANRMSTVTTSAGLWMRKV